jgi:hypothetical protein
MSMPRSCRISSTLQSEREPNVQHHSQPNDLGARLEVAEGAVFCHQAKVVDRPARLNRFCSDSTLKPHRTTGRSVSRVVYRGLR